MKNNVCPKCLKYEVDYLNGSWENKVFCYVCQDLYMKRSLKLKAKDIIGMDKLDSQLICLEMIALFLLKPKKTKEA